MRAAAALSEHPLATHAFGECVGRLLEVGGQRPDLLVIWATNPHAGALEDVVGASHRLLEPRVLLGAGAEAVVGGARRVEAAPALSMLAVWGLASLEPVRWAGDRGPDGVAAPHGPAGAEGTLLVLADPFDPHVGAVFDDLSIRAPSMAVVGGSVSAARHRGGNRLWLDHQEHRDGAVGVHLGPDERVRAVLSPGTRAVGQPMTVTAAQGRSLLALAGGPAIEVLARVVSELAVDDGAVDGRSLVLGVVDRPDGSDPGHDQVRMLGVRGMDRSNGALVLDGHVASGATAQFHLRDSRGADEDLCDRLRDADRAAAALVCSATALGHGYFGTADHQAELLADLLPVAAIAGMSSVDEYGPVAGAPAVVQHATSVLLFG